MTLKAQVLGTTLFTIALTGTALWANGIYPASAAVRAPAMCLDTPAPVVAKPVPQAPVESGPSCGPAPSTPSRTP
jgi:hypothetical protein